MLAVRSQLERFTKREDPSMQFRMSTWFSSSTDDDGNVCGTAMCIAGTAAALRASQLKEKCRTRITKSEASTILGGHGVDRWLGLDSDIASDLYLGSRKYPNGPQDGVWSGICESPLQLYGPEGAKIAIRAVDAAMAKQEERDRNQPRPSEP